MKSPETITVYLDGNKTADLQVEEFYPSAYCWDPGWTCYDYNTDTEYFVSESGSVYVQPENRCVGVAPEIAAESGRRKLNFKKRKAVIRLSRWSDCAYVVFFSRWSVRIK